MKQFLILFLFLCSTSIFAQDVIVKKDGSTIVCRVVELTSSEITYKKWGDLNGSNYVMNRSDASAINYQNGKKVNLSEATNLYMPNNQNDGSQKYNDKSLLKMDATIRRPATYKRKAVAIGVIGCTIGAGLLGTGIYFMFVANGHGHYKGMGAGLAAGGVGVAAGSLLWANSLAKKGRTIESASIYQYNLKLSNGSTLSAGIDMLSDRTEGYNTLGLGLRYNL